MCVGVGVYFQGTVLAFLKFLKRICEPPGLRTLLQMSECVLPFSYVSHLSNLVNSSEDAAQTSPAFLLDVPFSVSLCPCLRSTFQLGFHYLFTYLLPLLALGLLGRSCPSLPRTRQFLAETHRRRKETKKGAALYSVKGPHAVGQWH